jgi:hypothetical protein
LNPGFAHIVKLGLGATNSVSPKISAILVWPVRGGR